MPAATLMNPILFEHQPERGISGERELVNKSGSERRDWSFGKAYTPIAAADHSVACNKLTFANDLFQCGECVVHALAAAAREVNQFIADIEAPGHCDT